MPDDAGWRATRFRAGATEFAVLSHPVGDPAFPAVLTPAECDVCQHILSGATNREIAARRACSPRTVANQVAAILQKLGISSRAQLPLVLGAAAAGGHTAKG